MLLTLAWGPSQEETAAWEAEDARNSIPPLKPKVRAHVPPKPDSESTGEVTLEVSVFTS
jgi:hypothetical protein